MTFCRRVYQPENVGVVAKKSARDSRMFFFVFANDSREVGFCADRFSHDSSTTVPATRVCPVVRLIVTQAKIHRSTPEYSPNSL